MTDERRIIIGLITSTEFIQRIKGKWQVSLLESATAKRIASWCIEYYTKYNKAPGKEIESIFYQKAKNGLSKDLAEEIEEDILPSLSSEYEESSINIDHLVDDATKYFNQRNLIRFANEIIAMVETDKLIDAESLASTYKPFAKDTTTWIDFSSPEILERIEHAFTFSTTPLIEYPGAIGKFWNKHLCRGKFVSLMGPEKRGKTFFLLDLAMRACDQGQNVAFFQAGDMNEDEQIIRTGIYLAKRSNMEDYTGRIFEPVRDCIWNQLNKCERQERKCDFGIFEGKDEKFLKYKVTNEELKQALKDNKEYQPCVSCRKFDSNKWGTPWIKTVETGPPLNAEDAKGYFNEFFIKHSRHFKLSTHATHTLTVEEINSILNIWKQQDNFEPSVIIIDYADIMTAHARDERDKQNQIWGGLRGLSKLWNALVIAPTQSDADSYSVYLLSKKNFSEDKRKYAHVTAMWGLNQDPDDREKEIGIMRLNELVIRDGSASTKRVVNVLQNLKRGRAFITSYW
jgi:hypothetical protein